MANSESRCGECGEMLSIDSLAGPAECPHCRGAAAALGARPMPMPQVGGSAAPSVAAAHSASASDGAGDQESPAWAVLAMSLPWAVSFVFHVAVFLVLMFFTIIVVASGEGLDEPGWITTGEGVLPVPSAKYGDSDRPGSPVVTDFNGIEAYGAGKDPTDISHPALDLVDKAKGDKEDPYSTIGVLAPNGKATRGGSPDGKDLFGHIGDGDGRGSRFFGSGWPKASFGPMKKVVYVVDSSGSMFETFGYVKAELIRSISDLPSNMQFQVIFFSDGTPYELSIDGQAKLQQAVPAAKRAMKRWVDDRIAQSRIGRTDPRPALEKAFKTAGGPPHLIYFLTDGLFPRETLDTLRRLNPDRKVHINTIAFVNRVGEELMQKIAQENGGEYRFVNLEKLGQE